MGGEEGGGVWTGWEHFSAEQSIVQHAFILIERIHGARET